MGTVIVFGDQSNGNMWDAVCMQIAGMLCRRVLCIYSPGTY